MKKQKIEKIAGGTAVENLKLDEIEKLPRDYLTVREAAAVMGIACSTLYKNYLQMPFPVLRAGRSYRIPKKPFVEFMKNGRKS